MFSCTTLNSNKKIPPPTRLQLTTLAEGQMNACNGNSSLGTTKEVSKNIAVTHKGYSQTHVV